MQTYVHFLSIRKVLNTCVLTVTELPIVTPRMMTWSLPTLAPCAMPEMYELCTQLVWSHEGLHCLAVLISIPVLGISAVQIIEAFIVTSRCKVWQVQHPTLLSARRRIDSAHMHKDTSNSTARLTSMCWGSRYGTASYLSLMAAYKTYSPVQVLDEPRFEVLSLLWGTSMQKHTVQGMSRDEVQIGLTLRLFHCCGDTSRRCDCQITAGCVPLDVARSARRALRLLMKETPGTVCALMALLCSAVALCGSRKIRQECDGSDGTAFGSNQLLSACAGCCRRC